jgi:predicted PurR-regulated permease PerM
MDGTQSSPSEDPSSPGSWGTNTKLIIGLALVALAAGLVVQIRPLLTPLSMAWILAYLLYPLVEGLNKRTFLSWRGANNLVFFILLILVLTSLTASGFALVNQFQNLIEIVETYLLDLPGTVAEFLQTDPVFVMPIIGTEIQLADYIESLNIDLLALSNQLLSVVQPALGEVGGILTSVASSAFSVLGWGSFVLAVAYLTLGEARNGRRFLKTELAGLSYDIGRMTRELSYIWNAFLRGQVLVFLLASTTMFILLSILGVRYALGLAILAGLARFIPYIGQYISAIVNALVAFFLAEGNYLGMEAFPYMLLVVGLAFLHDQIYDSLVIPQLIGYVLGVHPALVLIVALIAVRWIGVLGLLLAAPVLSSFQLLFSYVIRKMLDQPSWPEDESAPPTLREQFASIYCAARDGLARFGQKIGKLFKRIRK